VLYIATTPTSSELSLSLSLVLSLTQGYVDRGEGDARARIFFYKCEYISGEINYKAGSLNDYMWVTNDELLQHLDPELGEVHMCV